MLDKFQPFLYSMPVSEREHLNKKRNMMATYTPDNMSLLLGTCTSEEAEKFAYYLLCSGYTLEIFEGEDQYRAFIDGREIEEFEWHWALSACGF